MSWQPVLTRNWGWHVLLLAGLGAILAGCAGIREERPLGMEYWERLREIAAAADAAGDFTLSDTAYDKLLERAEFANPVMLVKAGIELQAAGHGEKARMFFDEAVNTPFLSKAQRLTVGRMLLQAGASASAERLARVGMRRHYYDKAMMNMLAVTLDIQGRHDEARPYYLDIVGDSEDRRRFGVNYLLSLLLAGDAAEARAFASVLRAEGMLPRRFEPFLALEQKHAGCISTKQTESESDCAGASGG